MGFAIPLATFLRTNLEKWMLDVLNKKKIEKQGILDSKLGFKYNYKTYELRVKPPL